MDFVEKTDKLTVVNLIKPPMLTAEVQRDENEIELENGTILQVSFDSISNSNIREKSNPKGDDGFIKILWDIIKNNIKNAPLFLKRNIIWIGPLLISWLVLWQIKTYFIPRPLSKIVMLLIFLTATYNNFVAKAIYIGFIYGSAIPIFKDIKKEGAAPTINRYTKTFKVITNTFQRMGKKALPVFIFSTGIGLSCSNYLSRNNKIDKYLICLITGFIFFKAMSKGVNSIQLRLLKALAVDISKIFKIKNSVDNKFVYVCFTGLSAGFMGSFISHIMYGVLGDNGGYILGVLAMAGGIALNFISRKNENISTEK